MESGKDNTNDNENYSRLMRIASALNCSIEKMYENSIEDTDQTSELLKLWLLITSDQDRKKLLIYARNIATHVPPVKAA